MRATFQGPPAGPNVLPEAVQGRLVKYSSSNANGHMITTLDTLAIYFVRVAPGLCLGAMMLFLVRRDSQLRIILYLALFILLRDALTPLGLWSFGTQGFFWMRLHND